MASSTRGHMSECTGLHDAVAVPNSNSQITKPQPTPPELESPHSPPPCPNTYTGTKYRENSPNVVQFKGQSSLSTSSSRSYVSTARSSSSANAIVSKDLSNNRADTAVELVQSVKKGLEFIGVFASVVFMPSTPPIAPPTPVLLSPAPVPPRLFDR